MQWKTWISWVWGFEVVHAVKGSFEVAPSPQMLQKDSADAKATKGA